MARPRAIAAPPDNDRGLNAIYQNLLRPLLFALDAETAHHVVSLLLRTAHRSRLVRAILRGPPPAPSLRVRALGMDLASPVGLAAGFDKGANMYNAMGALGFASVEVGTVTAHAQPGNPRPRLFRLPLDRAVINRMGFNNPGAAAVQRALERYAPDGVRLGVNIGKSKVASLENAAADYAESARRLGRFADYVVVNVSSPNTPGLRSLQSVDALRPILQAVRTELQALPRVPPLLVKIAPDLADEDVDAVVDLAVEQNLAGMVATNTTIDRQGLRTPGEIVAMLGAGGLSGAPLRERSLGMLRRVRARAGERLELIASGGIENADHVLESLRAGASVVQLYTAMVFHGPGVVHAIHRELERRVAQAGCGSIGALVRREAQLDVTRAGESG